MLRKLLRRPARRDAAPGRTLTGASDLRAGDLLTFKHRLSLPEAVQGQTFEVSKVETYQFEDGLHPQLALDGAEAGRVYLSFKDADATELCLSKAVPRKHVLRLFDEAAFAALWDDDFADLDVAHQLADYAGWLAGSYAQTKNAAEGYFYARDCRGERLSQYQDDDAEPFRYHECEDDSGRFGLTVEVWGDGATDVSLDVNCPADVIDAMWPGDGAGHG